jgi:hypothetical protein
LFSSLKKGPLQFFGLGKTHSSHANAGSDNEANCGADDDDAPRSLERIGVQGGVSSKDPSHSSSVTTNSTGTSTPIASSSQAPVQFTPSVRVIFQLSFVTKPSLY